LLSVEGRSVSDADLTEAAAKGGPHVTRGFRAFIASWKETEIARAKSR
jgi:hypothetical protein